MPTAEFVIEVLTKEHAREEFDCGNAELNAYLRTQARQEMERGAAVVYALVPAAARHQIAGFYTLSSSSVRLSDWPEAVRKKLPRYPLVPVTLLGRLGIGTSYRGQRLGERLLVDALRRSVVASRAVGSVAVVVDAKDEEVAAFYSKYGFIPLSEHPLRLFLPMRAIAKLEGPQ